MTVQIKPGERVEHRLHGEGVVIELTASGFASVRFGNRTELVESRNLISIEQQRRSREAARNQRKEKDEKRRAEDIERQNGLQMRQALEAKRGQLIGQLRKRFRSDFLGARAFFDRTCTPLLTLDDYERESAEFAQVWIGGNTPLDERRNRRIPDMEQAAAIAAVGANIQVVARAGSGKTSTIVNRTLFLQKHCRVAPSEMLLLAFNRKAALEIRKRLLVSLDGTAAAALKAETDQRSKELQKKTRRHDRSIEEEAVAAVAGRLSVSLPHVMTFHALAYAIVHPEESLLYDGPTGESQGLSRAFQQVVDDHLQLPEHRAKIRELMLAHFRESWDRIVEGHHDGGMAELLRFRRSLPRESLRREYVKSFGEKAIADFLFEHDIAYKYEQNHWWSGINYRPDFTVFTGENTGVVIEYFGLTGDTDYDEMTTAKRAYWGERKGWTLLEYSPSDITNDGADAFRERVREDLEALGVRCVRLPEEEIWHRIRERAIDRFTEAAINFVGRCRKLSLLPDDLEERIRLYTPLSAIEGKFLPIALNLYRGYCERLRATGEDDFDGLMQRAGTRVTEGITKFRRKSGEGDLCALRYVFIDEFQDFSALFYQLIVAIREHNPQVEFFCVGDDWQAINGFAGSDLKFLARFLEYMGDARRMDVSTNYRSSQQIVSAGNALMDGLGKPARAHRPASGSVLIADMDRFEPSFLERERHSGDSITPAVVRLATKGLAEGLDVALLCRRNAVPWFVNYDEEGASGERGLERFLELVRAHFPKGLRERITISTVHKYKGLEKPMVIVLDAVARSFPLIHPDWVFSRILGESLEKIIEEERRLFYVALTRAVETLVVITDGRSRSPFLEGLKSKCNPLAVDWSIYPPQTEETTRRLVVSVGNQPGRGGSATYRIKDKLHASGYRFQSTTWKCWVKSFPAEGFTIDVLKREVWAAESDGLEIRIADDRDVLVGNFFVDVGIWESVGGGAIDTATTTL